MGPVTKLGTVVCVMGALLASAPLRAEDGKRRNKPDSTSNEIQLIVDGAPRKTWSVGELMDGRFDWVSPSGRFAPAVPVAFVLDSEESGLSRDRIAAVTFRGARQELRLGAADLALLERLVLRVDLVREGTWQLAGRDAAAEERLESLLGDNHLVRVARIEVTLHPSPGAGP